jgi:hypothetical protein
VFGLAVCPALSPSEADASAFRFLVVGGIIDVLGWMGDDAVRSTREYSRVLVSGCAGDIRPEVLAGARSSKSRKSENGSGEGEPGISYCDTGGGGRRTC